MTDVETAWFEYRKKLLSFTRSKVATLDDAEDILSDVFAKLAKVSLEGRAPDKLSAWLYRVTKNSIVDYYRAKKTTEPLSNENEPF